MVSDATTVWRPRTRIVSPGRARQWLSGRADSTFFLSAAVAIVVGTAPLEGYLIDQQPQLGKLPAVILLVTWLWVRIRQQRLPELQPVHLVLGTLALVVLLSTALHLTAPFSVEYAIRWIPFIVICAILVDVVAHDVSVRVVFAAALFGAAVAAIGALYSVFASGDLRAAGPLPDPNDLAYVLVAALPLAAAFTPRTRMQQIVLGGAAVLLVLGAAATLSRGGAIGLAVAVTWLLVRRAIRLRTVIYAAIAIAVAATAAWIFANPLVSAALGQKGYIAESNVDTRLLRWHVATQMLGDNPLFGVGPGGFRSEYAGVSNLAEIAEMTPVTHNMYLEVAAELGIIGIAVFIGLIVGAFVSSERALRNGAPPRMTVAVQASLAAIAVSSISLSEEYYLALWSVLAVAYAIHARSLCARWT